MRTLALAFLFALLAAAPAAAQRTFRIVPLAGPVTVGDTLRPAFAATDVRGRTVTAPAAYCGSFAPAVLRSTDWGLVGQAPGTALVVCAWYTEVDSLTVMVVAPPAPPAGEDPDSTPPATRTLVVVPDADTIAVGTSTSITVEMNEPTGVYGCSQCAWTSSDTAIAEVVGSGTTVTVRGLAPGTAIITATSQHPVSGSATVVVVAGPTPAPPQNTPPSGAAVLAADFEAGTLAPFTTGSGGSNGSANVFVAADPTGLFGGKIVHMHYAGCADVNRSIAADVPVRPGGTLYVRGALVIPTPQAFMADAMRKLFYIQRVPNDGSFIVLKTDGGRLKLEWPTRPWILSGPTIAFDRKYTLEMGFRVNSAPGAKDGWIRVWLDGHLVIDVQNTDIVTSNSGSLLRRVLVGQQSQGHNLECHDEWRYWDDVRIGTSR